LNVNFCKDSILERADAFLLRRNLQTQRNWRIYITTAWYTGQISVLLNRKLESWEHWNSLQTIWNSSTKEQWHI